MAEIIANAKCACCSGHVEVKINKNGCAYYYCNANGCSHHERWSKSNTKKIFTEEKKDHGNGYKEDKQPAGSGDDTGRKQPEPAGGDDGGFFC